MIVGDLKKENHVIYHDMINIFKGIKAGAELFQAQRWFIGWENNLENFCL